MDLSCNGCICGDGSSSSWPLLFVYTVASCTPVSARASRRCLHYRRMVPTLVVSSSAANGLKRLCLSATFCSRFSPLGAIWWRQYVREFCFPINVLVHQVTCRCRRFSGRLCRKCRGFSSSHQAISDGTKRSTVVLRKDLCVFCRNHYWIPSSP